MQSLVKRVTHYVDIDETRFGALNSLPHRVEIRNPGETIVNAGDVIDYMFVVEKGWAIRSSMLEDGRRQIFNFMIPGDCFDMMSIVQAKSDHTVSAATEVTLRRVSTRAFFNAVYGEPDLATAFWWVAVQEEAIMREQIIRIGRRSATERIAHLLLELNRRLAMIEGHENNFVDLPVPQALIADALGLSVVHVSRTFTKLKKEGFIRPVTHGVEILDRKALVQLCDFDYAYLRTPRLMFS